nr:hypothetical protein CFP56_00446 [Quercus suber]
MGQERDEGVERQVDMRSALQLPGLGQSRQPRPEARWMVYSRYIPYVGYGQSTRPGSGDQLRVRHRRAMERESAVAQTHRCTTMRGHSGRADHRSNPPRRPCSVVNGREDSSPHTRKLGSDRSRHHSNPDRGTLSHASRRTAHLAALLRTVRGRHVRSQTGRRSRPTPPPLERRDLPGEGAAGQLRWKVT